MFSQSQAWLLLLVDVSIKVFLLALVAAAALAVFRVKNSHVRHRVWTAVLLGMLLMPALVQVVPGLTITVPSIVLLEDEQPTEVSSSESREGVTPLEPLNTFVEAPHEFAGPMPPTFLPPSELESPPLPPSDEPIAQVAPIVVASESVVEAQESSETVARASVPIDWRVVINTFFGALLLTYFVVGSALVVRLLFGMLRAALLVSRSRKLNHDDVPLGLPPRTVLCENDSIRVPLTVGFLMPRVLLPANWREWGEEKLIAVLKHESTHIARGDYAVNLLAEWNRCVYWFHPLAWWIIRRLSDLAERNCDDAVIASTGDRTSYAKHLLEIAASVMTPNGGTIQTGVSMARSADVETRIDAILDTDRPLSRRLGWRSTLLLFAVVLPIIWVSAALRAAPPQESVNPSEEPAASAQEDVAEPQSKPVEKLGMVFAGRVLNQAGDGVAGAKLHLFGVGDNLKERLADRLMSETDETGHFKFTYDVNTIDGLVHATLVASRGGSGPDWVELADVDDLSDLTLRLASDETPIIGRILDLEGKPVVGASVGVGSIRAMYNDSLDEYIRMVKAGNGSNFAFDKHVFRGTQISETRTDDKGRFRLTGVGDRRVVELTIVGPSIEHASLRVMTQESEPIKGRPGRGFESDQFIYGASFEYVARPSRPIVGVVRDSKTNKPVAGVTVGVLGPTAQAETDKNGRFKVIGAPKGKDYKLVAYVTGRPYLVGSKTVEDSPGFEPLEVELTIPRGIVIRGQVTDKVTGDPIAAEVSYYPLYPNTNVTEGVGYDAVNGMGEYATAETDAEGNFEIAVLAGAGFLAVQTHHRNLYATANVDAAKFFKDKFPYGGTIVKKHRRDLLYVASGTDGMGAMPQSNFQGVELLFIDENAKQTKHDIQLVSTVQIKGILLDPAGKPISGVRAFGLSLHLNSRSTLLNDNTFTISGMGSKENRTILFRHDARKLVAAADVSGDQKGPLTIKLRRWGEVKGRMLDDQDEPLPNLMIGTLGRVQDGELPGDLPRLHSTDDEGRFHIDGLVPGRTYRLRSFESAGPSLRVIVTPGQLIDAGDVKGDKGAAKAATKNPGRDNVVASVVASKAKESDSVAEDHNLLRYEGRVVDLNDKPVAGAKLHLFYWLDNTRRFDPRPLGVTDAKGRFEFTRAKTDFPAYFEAPAWIAASIVAVADGHGLAFASSVTFETTGNARRDMPAAFVAAFKRVYGDQNPILKFEKDDVPIRGRIVDLEGRGVAGASVRIREIWATKQRDLSAWEQAAGSSDIEFWTLRKEAGLILNTWANNGPILTFLPAVKTDAEGRFELRGVGRERIAGLVVSGPHIELSQFHARTRKGQKIVVPHDRHRQDGRTATIYGAEFIHAVGPSRPITGTVTDAETSKPIAHIVIQALQVANDPVLGRRNQLVTMTDQQGRFRLAGLPVGQSQIVALNRSKQPYLPSAATVSVKAGADTKHDFQLKRGLWLEGRVTDKNTGKPVRGHIDYFTFATNPNLPDAPGFQRAMVDRLHSTDREGRYRVPVLPGRGLIAFAAENMFNYPRGVVAQGSQAPSDKGFYETVPRYLIPLNYHYLTTVDPKKDEPLAPLDMKLVAGRTVSGRVVDTDNNPVSGAYIAGFVDVFSGWMPLDSDEFSVEGYLAGKPRKLLFYHPARNLSGSLILRGEKPAMVVKLVPAGTIKGRIVDANGNPMPELILRSGIERELVQGVIPWDGSDKFLTGTADDGRFELKGLAPGMKYRVHAQGYRKVNSRRILMHLGNVVDGETVEAGEVKDLGDIQLKKLETLKK